MSSRTWVFSRMTTGNSSLQALVPAARVKSSTAQDHAPTPDNTPFIRFRSSAHVPDLRGDDATQVRNETFMIFVHDIPGDYMRIDTIMGHLRTQLEDVVDQPNNIIRSRWLEDSEDHRDEDM